VTCAKKFLKIFKNSKNHVTFTLTSFGQDLRQ